MAELSSVEKNQIDVLEGLGYTRRKIAETVLGRASRNSSVTDYILRRNGENSPDEACPNYPKILVFDIETSFQIFGGFGRFNQNFSESQVFENSKLLGLCAKWLGSDNMIEIWPSRFKEWGTPESQKEMLEKAWQLLDRADYVIAHNAKFDTKMLNSFFLFNGLTKPSPYRIIDTLRIAKSHFRFDSNRLDSLGKFLGVGQKTPHTGFQLWRECAEGNSEAWRHMIAYCSQDVRLLEEIYYKIRAWDKNFANLGIHYDDGDMRCGVCLSKDLQDTGKTVQSNTQQYDLLKCGECGAWQRNRKAVKRSTKTTQGV